MGKQRYYAANNWRTALDGSITDIQDSIDVVDASDHPDIPFKMTVNDEIMNVTAVNINVLTVERGQEDTAAQSHDNGDRVENRPTAEAFNNLGDDVDEIKSTLAEEGEEWVVE